MNYGIAPRISSYILTFSLLTVPCLRQVSARGVIQVNEKPATQRSKPHSENAGAAITQSNIQHNLNQVNAYRARAGAPALKLDAQLTAFAQAGSIELMRNHIPHKHFRDADVWQNGFAGGAAENQGDPNGWFPGPTNQVIDAILKAMMNEGPGGGHHDNMLNPKFRRIGIGLVKDSQGRLYLTNDFSE